MLFTSVLINVRCPIQTNTKYPSFYFYKCTNIYSVAENKTLDLPLVFCYMDGWLLKAYYMK